MRKGWMGAAGLAAVAVACGGADAGVSDALHDLGDMVDPRADAQDATGAECEEPQAAPEPVKPRWLEASCDVVRTQTITIEGSAPVTTEHYFARVTLDDVSQLGTVLSCGRVRYNVVECGAGTVKCSGEAPIDLACMTGTATVDPNSSDVYVLCGSAVRGPTGRLTGYRDTTALVSVR